MPNDTGEARAESLHVLLPWGLPAPEGRADLAESAAVWLSGGALLFVWTLLALLLTA